MASLCCHGHSDVNKTWSCGNLFPISLLMPTWLTLKVGTYTPKKIQSSHLNKQHNNNCKHAENSRKAPGRKLGV